MIRQKWFVLSIGGWVFLTLVGQLLNLRSADFVLGWTFLQQVWLIITGCLFVSGQQLFPWNKREIFRGIAAGGGLFFLNAVVGTVAVYLFTMILGGEAVNDLLAVENRGMQLMAEFAENRGPFFVLLLVGFGAPLSEELLFRGVLLGSLRKHLPSATALVLTALAFAGVHFYLIQFFPLFVSGLVLGGLFLVSDGLTRPIMAHVTVNTIVFIVQFML